MSVVVWPAGRSSGIRARLLLILLGEGCAAPNPLFGLSGATVDAGGAAGTGGTAGMAGTGGMPGTGGMAGVDARPPDSGPTRTPDASTDKPPPDAARPPPAADTNPDPPLGSEHGLKGEYFNQANLTSSVLTRVDPTIDFDWQRGRPDPAVVDDGFSIRWTGKVQPRYSETYTFHTACDDGCRLWVNGSLLVDDWVDHPLNESMGTIVLAAGKGYDLRMEYFDRTFYAIVKLSWSSRSQVMEIVPTERLYPAPP